jgi:hypothetical protein
MEISNQMCKSIVQRFSRVSAATALLLFCAVSGLPEAQGQSIGRRHPNAGGGSIIVQPRFGGLIFGFDIDPNGGEGLLSEAAPQADGSVIAAVETFDPKTGAILKTVVKTHSKDDFVTLGIEGNTVGLIEREHVVSQFDVQRSFEVLNPLSGNKFTGHWTPRMGKQHIVNEIKRSTVNSKSAVYAVDISNDQQPIVFSTDVGANTFGPQIPVLDRDFNFEGPPVLAYDGLRNRAILGHNKNTQFIEPPKIGIVNLTTGAFRKFSGLGLGVIDGIAVDSEDNVICTDTTFDGGVQFYNLTKHTRVSHILPGVTETDTSSRGAHIEYDPVNKLFLVAQPISATGTGSSIVVYDIKGNFVESVDGLNFTSSFNVFPVHIALDPNQRSGFVDGPDPEVRNIQSFTY